MKKQFNDLTNKWSNRMGKATVLMCIVSLGACNKDVASPEFPTVDELIAGLGMETLPDVVHPANNPTSAEKIALGKELYWDPVVGGENDVSCATCHHANFGYGDGLDLSIGVGGSGLGPARTEEAGGRIPRVGRNAPSFVNAAYNGLLSKNQSYDPLTAPMFWDSRMQSLEAQAQGPPGSHNEMRGDNVPEGEHFDTIVARLKAIPEYVTKFDAVFGGSGGSGVTQDNFAKAIACFERTIVSKNSKYDQYVAGSVNAMSATEKNGAILFFGKAKCNECHSGPMFSDFDFKVLGVAHNPNRGAGGEDTGKDGEYKFRTPTVRNTEHSAPYMHNGMIATLEDLVDFYNDGVSANSNVSAVDMEPLGLTAVEKAELVAFIKALSDDSYDKTIPTSVPSGLQVGGNI